MLKSTKTALVAMMGVDPSISKPQADAALAILSGESAAGLTNPEPIDRALSREAVAQLLGVSKRTVTQYARCGVIRPLRFGAGGKRAVGYSEMSVRAALANISRGREVANA